MGGSYAQSRAKDVPGRTRRDWTGCRFGVRMNAAAHPSPPRSERRAQRTAAILIFIK
jgi:hypothetical protein